MIAFDCILSTITIVVIDESTRYIIIKNNISAIILLKSNLLLYNVRSKTIIFGIAECVTEWNQLDIIE